MGLSYIKLIFLSNAYVCVFWVLSLILTCSLYVLIPMVLLPQMKTNPIFNWMLIAENVKDQSIVEASVLTLNKFTNEQCSFCCCCCWFFFFLQKGVYIVTHWWFLGILLSDSMYTELIIWKYLIYNNMETANETSYCIWKCCKYL